MTVTLPSLMSSLGSAFGSSGSAYYYPTLILSQTLPADPLSVSAVDFGDLSAVSPSLPSDLCQTLGCGSGTSAHMTLSNLSVTGLSNGIVQQPQVNGETVTITVGFGNATPPVGLILSQPSISGSFTIMPQCSSSAPSIQGTFTTTLTGCSATLTMTVDGTFTVSNCNIQFSAASTSTTFSVTSPVAQSFMLGAILDKAFQNLSSADHAVVAAIGTAANAQATALADILTPFLQSAANPSLVSFLLSVLYKESTNPSNPYYMPKVVENASNPTLEPYKTDGAWSIGDINQLDPSATNIICSSAGSTQNENWIATPGQPSPITLSGITIVGFSNGLPLPALATTLPSGDVLVTGLAVFGQVQNWPHTFSLEGTFQIAPSCCVTNNFQTCSSPADCGVGAGTFTVAIRSAGVAAKFLISSNGNNLTATAQKLWFLMDPNKIDPNNITTTVDITSITDDNERSQWNQQAAKAMNTPQGCLSLLSSLQTEANQSSILDQLSSFLTSALNNINSAS